MITYNQAKLLLENRSSKKIDHNTHLIRAWDHDLNTYKFIIQLYDTDIITIMANNRYILRNGGFFTKTTKDRLNKYGPAKIHQKDCQWYVNGYTPFVDGMIYVTSPVSETLELIGVKS